MARPRSIGRADAPRIAALVVVVALAILAAWPKGSRAWPLAVAIAALAALRPAVGPALPSPAGVAVVGYLGFVVASTCAVHAVFFGEDRYQIVVMPALAVLAGLALSRAPRPAA